MLLSNTLMIIISERERDVGGVEKEAGVLGKRETRRGCKREAKGGKYDQNILCACMKMS